MRIFREHLDCERSMLCQNLNLSLIHTSTFLSNLLFTVVLDERDEERLQHGLVVEAVAGDDKVCQQLLLVLVDELKEGLLRVEQPGLLKKNGNAIIKQMFVDDHQ